MKTLAFCFGIFLLTSHASAQYAIDWFTLDDGGGYRSGGAYTLTGTIGQPDAAISSGGNYTLQGGFWSAFAAVQTEGAPSLRIVCNVTNVTLAWPNPSPGFQLQETTSLSAPNWLDVNTPPNVVGAEKQITSPLLPGTRFFRLRKP